MADCIQLNPKKAILMIGTKGYSFTNLQMTFFQLSISIKSALEKQSALLEKIRNNRNTGLEVNSDEYETFDMINESFFTCFKEIIKEIDEFRDDENKLTRYDKLISEVQDFLKTEYLNPNLNPDMIATHFRITSEYLRRLYKKTSGYSLDEYMTRFRLCKACELLENIGEPISEIALKAGFVNINYFYAFLKRVTG